MNRQLIQKFLKTITAEDAFTFIDIETRRIDHLGLVVAAMEELQLIQLSDKCLNGERDGQRVSLGQRVAAMVIHLMSFQNRTLYQTPQFLEDYLHENLLGEGASPDAFNDDALGRMLDEIYEYGAAKFFQTISMLMLTHKKLAGNSLRLDSTSMAVHGAYENSERDDPDEGVRITFGHSKDGRPDLKQVMLALVTTGPANLPIIAKPLSGNASDKTEFRTIIKEFQQQMKGPHTPLWIMDSAGYTKKWLKEQKPSGDGFYPWLTRVPESIMEAKSLVRGSYKKEDWECFDQGYQAIEFEHQNYGGIKQLWILYRSEQAYERENETLTKNINKEHDQLTKALWHLSNVEFSCKEDALRALHKALKKARYHMLLCDTVTHENKHGGPGRPAIGSKPKKIVYKIKGEICEKTAELNKMREICGRFILATNHVGESILAIPPATMQAPSSEEPEVILPTDLIHAQTTCSHNSRAQRMLSTYKELQGTENAFKMLKDKEFMMNRFFLHKESRIEALLVIFALALFVYNYTQLVIVSALNKAKIKLRGPGGSRLKTNTLKRVFEIFRTVTALHLVGSKELYRIDKLNAQQLEILHALDPPYRRKYALVV